MTNTPADREPRLLRNERDRRYEIWLGDTRAGVATFRESDTRVTFLHTVIDPAFGGRGLGTLLAAFALQDTVDRKKRIVPLCPFIAAYVEDHDEFAAHIDMPVPS